MSPPDAKREAVAHACEVDGVSQRRACQALNIDRSTVRYTSTRRMTLGSVEAMKAMAAERRRFGYPRSHIMLDRQRIVMNQKKLRRLYREEKLQVRRRDGRKAGRWARARSCSWPIVPTLDGSWTSSPIPSPMAVASGCSPSSMTTRANALH
jgi:transposase InsO family protein